MNIDELKKQKIWVNWKAVPQKNGKIKKVPVAYNGAETGSDDAHKDTWTTFENVEGKPDGVAFALRNGMVAIDIDNNSYDNEMIKDIINLMDSYTEYSPSGKGYHIIFIVDVSKIPYSIDSKSEKKLNDKYYVKNIEKDIECYIGGLTNRVMTYTGNVFRDKPIQERTEQLLQFLNKYMVKPVNNFNIASAEDNLEEVSKTILEIISHCANAEKFKKLYYEGNTDDYNNDESSADMALCSILAFYCGDNEELIDYMFSNSSLYRPKWDRADYKANTIKKAIEGCNGNFFNNGVDIFLLNKFKELKIEKSYKADDIHIGKLFSTMYKDKLKFNTTAKEWYFYNGKVWIIDEQGMNAINLMKTFVLTLIQYSVSLENDAYKTYCKKLLDVKKRDHILKDSQSFLHISQEEFDIQDNLINCQNGTFNIDTYELQPHNPNDLLTKITNVIYDQQAKSERWEKFIDEIMEGNKNKIEYLQKAYGYSLLAGNPLSKIFILIGRVRAGKGTLNESFSYMLGGEKGYSQTIMPSSLAVQKNKNGSTTSADIAKLHNCRYLSMSEPEQDYKLDEALVKTITGGDTITARFLHKNFFNFVPKFTLFMNSNHYPHITDSTVFESDRIVAIEFNRQFKESERDIGLKAFFKEPEQVSAIFNWAIEGLKKYEKEGLIPPQEIVDATLKYYYESDTLKLFIDTELEKDTKNITVAQVWERLNDMHKQENCPYRYVNKRYFDNYFKRQPFYREQGTVNGKTHKHIIVGMKLKK